MYKRKLDVESTLKRLQIIMESERDYSSTTDKEHEAIDKFLNTNYHHTSKEFIRLLRTTYHTIKHYDFHHLLRSEISEFCAAVADPPHTKLYVEIATNAKHVIIPENFDNFDSEYVFKLTTEMLNEPDRRQSAVVLLGRLPDKYVLDIIVKFLDSSDDKLSAIEALSKRERLSAIPILEQIYFSSDNQQTREKAIIALGEMKSNLAIESLLKIAKVETLDVQRRCIFFVGYIDTPEAYEALRDVLNDEELDSRKIMTHMIIIDAVQSEIDLQSEIPKLSSEDREAINRQLNFYLSKQK
ncbi:MAG: HEAT repeat domain-containing protein [Chloroflexota bacterium]